MTMSKNKKSGFGKFLLGAGVGATLGMLLTKKTGKETKLNEIMEEISELDKEKALKIAKKKAEQIKVKSEELVEYVIEKGTPVLEKSACLVKEKAIAVTKEVLKKLEQEEK